MPTPVIRLICPNLLCRSILCVPASARGKDVRCRQCSSKIRIPQDPKASAPAVAAPPSATPKVPEAA